jgi:tRNA modification GTPase
MNRLGSPRARLLTPWGKGGVAVILLAGADFERILGEVFRPLSRTARPFSPGKPFLTECLDENGKPIDEVVIAAAPEGRGIEICCHGGIRIVQRILARLESLGVRHEDQSPSAADMGWGPIKVIEADAMAAMSEAATPLVVRWLGYQATQGLAAAVEEAVEAIHRGKERQAIAMLESLMEAWTVNRRLLRPARIVLTGPPNAGKSTLANAMSERQGSIVTDEPGTTRDWVEHAVSLNGIPATVVDTAGVRASNDRIEAEAIERSRAEYALADLIIVVVDCSKDIAPQLKIEGELFPLETTVVAFNKQDLIERSTAPTPDVLDYPFVKVSAMNGTGLDGLRRVLIERLGLQDFDERRAGVFTESQWEVVDQARDCLSARESEAALLRLKELLAPVFETTL